MQGWQYPIHKGTLGTLIDNVENLVVQFLTLIFHMIFPAVALKRNHN